MNAIAKIEKQNFLATAADIEAMARARQEGVEQDHKAQGTYLRVLIALTAHEIGGKTAHLSRRRGKLALSLSAAEIGDHVAVLERVNSMAYAAVMKAVVTPDIERKEDLPQSEQSRRALERNRRTNYARSAMATVRAFVHAGRDIRDISVATITKGALREITAKYVPEPQRDGLQRIQRSAQRATQRIVEEAEDLAVTDPEQAEQLLEALVKTLQETIEKIHSGEISVDHGATGVIANHVRDAARRRA